MTSLKKLERDRTAADLASVESLLAGLTEEDVMARLSLEGRRDELQQHLAEMVVGFDDGLASAALFFGGRPVAGQRGVESEFAGNAVAKFQDLVAKLLVQEFGDLGQRGPVPNKAASTMHITSIVRGSFGFLMEELQPQGQLVDTALSKAVDEASRSMAAFGSDDESEFQTAAGEVDSRVLATAGEFFGLLGENHATLRLVTSDHDDAFSANAVQLAVQRAATTVVREDFDAVPGQLNGALPEGHMFEFTNVLGAVIRGRVDRAIPTDQLMQWNLTLLNTDVTARFKIRRVFKDGEFVRESHTLLGLDGDPGVAQIEQQT
jgi:hypothetical protein